MEITCKTENDLLPAAEKLLQAYPDSRVFAFYGKMGAGKTAFIKAIGRELGAEDMIQSPSFAIVHEYKSSQGGSLFHFDFYRIKNLEEVFDLGYEDYFFSGHYCFVEWPELIEDLLPDNVVRVRVEVDEEERSRTIFF
ncbi:MAG: tRNA (adenosine(37)-N6)-threonylcarbamoyltransferase complex ATPase subunit type 1 TsaE [Syntrophothermus sp.]